LPSDLHQAPEVFEFTYQRCASATLSVPMNIIFMATGALSLLAADFYLPWHLRP
jgi:hypothetical protein